MNALTPALPPLQSNPASAAPAPAEGDSGFADALQQARKPKPAARDKGVERPREGRPADGKPASRAETPRPADKTPAKASAEAAPADADTAGGEATADTDPAAAPVAGTEGTLPPWLEAALARPARPDPAAAATPRAAAEGTPAAARGKDIAAAARPATALASAAGTPAEAATRATTASRGTAEAAAEAPSFAAALQQAGGEPHRGPLAAESGPALPAAAAGVSGPAASRADASAPTERVERAISAPLHGPEFAPALGAQLNLLVKDGVTEARLHLNPAEMGPISVQIQIEGQTARVEMVAEQAATRQVLEQSMPALAGALRDNGLTLAGGGVFEQARDPRQGAGNGQLPPGHPGAAPGGTGELEAGAELRPAALPQGMLDLYA